MLIHFIKFRNQEKLKNRIFPVIDFELIRSNDKNLLIYSLPSPKNQHNEHKQFFPFKLAVFGFSKLLMLVVLAARYAAVFTMIFLAI
jgi:hypothetical protein